ncbi:hypothetical protein JTH99_004694, partial [Escherichia coli]|nr:hypothetical protein [Escherichia coli]
MINMPQNGPDDQVRAEKNIANVIPLNSAGVRISPTDEELASVVEIAEQQIKEREAERQRIAENAVKATEPQQLDVDAMKPQIMTLDEMLTKCVWVADGERVAYLD